MGGGGGHERRRRRGNCSQYVKINLQFNKKIKKIILGLSIFFS